MQGELSVMIGGEWVVVGKCDLPEDIFPKQPDEILDDIRAFEARLLGVQSKQSLHSVEAKLAPLPVLWSPPPASKGPRNRWGKLV